MWRRIPASDAGQAEKCVGGGHASAGTRLSGQYVADGDGNARIRIQKQQEQSSADYAPRALRDEQ